MILISHSYRANLLCYAKSKRFNGIWSKYNNQLAWYEYKLAKWSDICERNTKI